MSSFYAFFLLVIILTPRQEANAYSYTLKDSVLLDNALAENSTHEFVIIRGNAAGNSK